MRVKEMTEKKITDKKQAFFLFCICWMAYFTCYIGRLNFSSAMAAMIEEQVLTKTQAGTISMVYFFVYGAGQLLNGFLGDKLQPGRMIFSGLALSMLCNLLMGTAGAFGVMVIVWGVNGYAQSMVWPPIIRIFAKRLEEAVRLRYCVDIVSTQAAGTLAAYVLSAAVLSVSGWRTVFWGAGICLLLVAILWILGYARVERLAGENGVVEENSTENVPAERSVGKNGRSFGSLLLGGLWLIILPVVVHGILKDGVTSWVPTYILETFHTSASLSVLVTTVLPIVNLSGAYLARALYRKCAGNEVRASVVFFSVSVAALSILWLAGSFSMALTVALLAVITASMMGVNTLFVNLLPLRYEKEGKVSSVSGFLNACAYIGTAVSTFTIGVMVESLGWGVTVGSWLAVTAAGLVVCLAVKGRYRTGETQSSDSGSGAVS
ncbi:MFS transporter [Acetatifactor muris]|uniref:MFS transporter n=1 Tax=Acetatifactor muris TaxID=879566 RepID=UPI0023F4AA3B|nr:MFS transporter [Acetatifactor muris]